MKHQNTAAMLLLVLVIQSRCSCHGSIGEVDSSASDEDCDAESDTSTSPLLLAARGASPYEVLGVAKGSKQSVVTKIYRKLALRWHPDKNGGDDDSFAVIADACAHSKRLAVVNLTIDAPA